MIIEIRYEDDDGGEDAQTKDRPRETSRSLRLNAGHWRNVFQRDIVPVRHPISFDIPEPTMRSRHVDSEVVTVQGRGQTRRYAE